VNHDELPPALRDLQDQLRLAAERDVEVERRVAQRLRQGRWRRWLFVAVAAMVSAGGVAVADRIFDRTGTDETRDRVPRQDRPAADPGVITASATPDPAGGPPWAMRVFTNREGLECISVGRLLNGALGTYDAARTFRKLPVRISGACDSVARAGLLVTVHQRGLPEPRTIVYGLASGKQPVRVTIGGRTRTLRPGPFGSFIDVRAGLLDLRAALATTTVGGRFVSQPLD
jgi:hypothetical protein